VNVLQRRVSAAHWTILANAGSLVGTSAVTSLFGVVYWWLAARRFTTAAVGFSSAAISSMTLLGTISMLGFGTLLMGELSRNRGREGTLISSALVTVAVVSAGLGATFAVVAPMASPGLRSLSASPWSVMVYAAGVSLTAVTLVLDQAMIGLLRGSLQLARNSIFAIAKLLVLAAVSLWTAGQLGLSIYATWAAGNMISLILIAVFAARHGRTQSILPRRQAMKRIGRSALAHHVLNLSLQASVLALPLIVTYALSIEANAVFYIAWMVAGFAFVAPLALSLVLYAAGATDPAALQHKIRFTAGSALAIGVVSNIFLLIMGGFLLRVFGRSYADQGRVCLSVLGLGVFPLIVKDHFVALSRINGRVLNTAVLTISGGVVELVAAAIGARAGGLAGLAIAWDIALCLEALIMSRAVLAAAGFHAARLGRSAPAPSDASV